MNENGTIFSDSQASIQALTKQKPKRPFVGQIQTTMISLLNQNKEIYFSKVLSLTSIRGNEQKIRPPMKPKIYWVYTQ